MPLHNPLPAEDVCLDVHTTPAHQKLMDQLRASHALLDRKVLTMPKGTKEPTTAKSVYVKFTQPQDLELFARLEADAKVKRYDVSTYILLVLLDAYSISQATHHDDLELVAE